MKFTPIVATIFIASVSMLTGANAQKVYRCGASYSQTPCADATTVDVQDTRSKQQQSDNNALVKHEAATARAMRKERLQEEAQALQANTQAEQANQKRSMPASTAAAASSSKKGHSKKKNEPEYFTATAGSAKAKPKTGAAPSPTGTP